MRLPLEELEEKSCSKKCEGIFSRPTEVFLFGCNTLASKGADDRPVEIYFRNLLAHGRELEDAVRSTQEVYGVFGNSNRDTMKRIFQGVRNIYGFSGSGPLGNTVEPKLEKYFKGIDDYQNHLLEIESKRIVNGLERMNTWISDNNILKNVMSNTNFYQCSGNFPVSDDPIKNNICALKNSEKSIGDKLILIQEMLSGINALKYVPSILSFFNKHPPDYFQNNELVLFQELQKNIGAKRILLEGINTLDLVSEISYLHFLVMLDWMSPDEAMKKEKTVILKMLTPPITDFSRDSLCGYYDKFYEGGKNKPFYTIKYKDIPNNIYNSKNGIFVLGCLGFKDERIVTEIEKRYLKYKSKNFDQKHVFFQAIASTEKKSNLLDGFILSLLESKNEKYINHAISLAGTNKSSNSEIHKKILDLDDYEYISSYNLSKMYITDSKLLDRIINLVFKGNWDLFSCLMPMKEKLNEKQIDLLGEKISNLTNAELKVLAGRQYFIKNMPIKAKAKLIIKIINNDIDLIYWENDENVKIESRKSLSKYLESLDDEKYLEVIPAIVRFYPEKLSEKEIIVFAKFLEFSFGQDVENYSVIQLLSKNSINEKILFNLYKIAAKSESSFSIMDIIKNNIRKESKIHKLIIEDLKKNRRYTEQVVEVLFEYEKLKPTLNGQVWLLLHSHYVSDEIHKLFLDVGFFNQEVKDLYNNKYGAKTQY